MQTFLESVYTLQESFEHVGLGPSLLGHSICKWASVLVLPMVEETKASRQREGEGAGEGGSHTINARTREDLASFARWTQTVALDL